MSDEHNHEHSSECNHNHDHEHSSECNHDHTEEIIEKNSLAHWPIMLLGIIVGLLFISATFSYQVEETEIAVVKRNGKIIGTQTAGLHFKIPIINKIEKFDKRIRCFNGSTGRLEETYTKDSQSIIVGIFTAYKISNFEKFINSAGNISAGEERLNSLMRSAKIEIFGEYKFNQLINPNPQELKIIEIEERIQEKLNKDLEDNYGISIVKVGVSNINVPEKISGVIFKRMIAEREFVAQKTISQGQSESAKIKQEADRNKNIAIIEAEAEAKKIMAEGDAEAAEFYAEFGKEPELAIFLKKLDAMKKVMDKKTTIIFDTNSAPFDILKTNTKLKKSK